MKLLNHKKSIGIIIISMIATNAITYYYTTKKSNAATEVVGLSDGDSSFQSDASCDYKIKRMDGYEYIKPILFVDTKCESDKLSAVKQSINDLIENYKKIGVISSAACYIKEYNGNGWTGINTNEKFLPGSLMKVPELITFLKMEEANPGLLNKQLTYNQIFVVDKNPKYKSKSIVLGHTYTVRELLHYMIAYSDNNATSLLFANMDLNLFKKVFTDVGLTVPDLKAPNYPMSAREFSYFMRLLYNASYLNNKNSELATELLSQCNFKDGIIAGLPNATKVAHKFGESGTQLEQELSESAIVYLDNNPYVITVMTRGKDYKQLPTVVKEISGIVYQNMSQQ